MFSFLLIINGFSGPDSAGRSSWPSFTPFKVSVYLRDYAGSYVVRIIHEMPAFADSSTVYDTRHVANHDTRVGEWTNNGRTGSAMVQYCDRTMLRVLTCHSLVIP